MKKASQFVKATIIGGFFIVLPIVLVGLLVSKTIDIVQVVVEPIAVHLPVVILAGVDIAIVLAIFIICLSVSSRDCLCGRSWV